MKHFKLMKGVLACLLSLVLVATSITPTNEISAEEATTTVTKPNAVSASYNAEKDIVTGVSGTDVIYVLKKESGNTIKKGAKCYACSGTADDNTLLAIGVKGTNKDAYLYVCDKEFEETESNVKANLVIKGQAAKKITGVIDYTQADDPESTSVLSIKAVDSSKKTIADAQAIWSEDGTTWKKANEFKGSDLAKILENGGATLQVKMLGTDSPAVRTSKAVKVKIVKQGKAPTVKVDVKKDTFAIKNGMDFGLFKKNGEKYELVNGWHTILPQLKTAKTKTLEDSLVSTRNFKPLDKKDADATKAASENEGKVSYTSLKVKALGFNALNEIVKADITSSSGSLTDEYYLGVRTSATAKKPASAVTYFAYNQKAEKPIVYTESCVSGEYLVSSGTDFAKKGILLGTIANYNGADGTEGYAEDFKLKTTAGSGADTAAGSYEFAIINKSDLAPQNIVDWSTVAWKKLDPAKTKFNAKTKTKYNTVNGTTTKQVTAVLTATAVPDDFNPSAGVPDSVKTVIVVRRAGVKGKTADDAVVASNYIELYVLKSGKDYMIYSTEDQGETAYKYTIKFVKYTASTSGDSTTYGWKEASDVAEVSVWVKPGDDKYVTLPTVEGAALFAASDSGEYTSGSGIATETTGTNKGKYKVSLASNATAGKTEYIAVRQFANVKVVGVGSDSGSAVANSEKEIGKVIAGKVSSASGDTLTNGTTVTAYVGDVVAIPVINFKAPTGYASTSGDRTLVAGTGYTFDNSTNKVADGKVTVTVQTADEITVKVNEPVTPTYTVKYTTPTAPSGITLSVKNGDKDVLSGAIVNKGTVLTVTVTLTKLKSVKINGEAVTASEGKVTKTITVNADTVITVSDVEVEE